MDKQVVLNQIKIAVRNYENDIRRALDTMILSKDIRQVMENELQLIRSTQALIEANKIEIIIKP